MEDFSEFVASLTPRQTSDAIDIYQNTVGIACPACGDPFDDLIVCKAEYNQLSLDFAMDLCTGTHDSNPVLFTHKH